jgi:uncharacterized protein (DUF58 family)
MIPKDLFQKVRRIEITTSRLVTDIFAGQYHSVFKGQGIEFDEVREYMAGDDVRTIDWNVTARTGRVHVKKFVEERELTVMILVDASRSTRFGSRHALKSQIAAEISALLAFAATRNHDKVGLIIFTDGIERFIPPRKGLRHVLRIIREVLYSEPQGRKTDIVQALEYFNKGATRRSIAFLISDFFVTDKAQDECVSGERLKKTLGIVNKKHDLVAISLNDSREFMLPDCGMINLEDAETSQPMSIDSSNEALREKYRKINQRRLEKRQQLFRSTGLDYIDISTDTPYTQALVKFFAKRRARRF